MTAARERAGTGRDRRRSWPRIASLAALSLAWHPPEAFGESSMSLTAELQGAGGAHTSMPLDEVTGCEPGSASCRGGRDAGGRLRVEPAVSWNHTRVGAAIDLVCGDYYLNRSEIPASLRASEGLGLGGGCRGDVRRLAIEHRSAMGIFRAGQMGSHFGLGLLANDGRERSTFGERRSGDLVERVALTTFLSSFGAEGTWADRVSVSLAADLVRHDEGADLFAKGERALAGSLIAAYRESGARAAGLFLSYRHQDDDAGTGARVAVIDAYGSWAWSIADAIVLRGAAEWAWLRGTTTRVLSEQAFEGLDLDAFGGVGRIAVEGARRPSFRAELEGGFASGDDNPDDGVVRRFRFDPEYKAGLILFDRALAGSTARSAERAADPMRAGEPPLGIAELPTAGSIAGAAYGAATLSYVLPFDLTLNVGGVLARATGDLTDPVASTRSGGENTTLRGAPAGARHLLGAEIDVGVDYEIAWSDDWHTTASLQYGHLFPGPAFAASDGTPAPDIDAIFFRASLAAKLLER